MKELLVRLDASAGKALYEQIYEYIRGEIMDGRLSRGERLPSARLLAQNLQVSRSTADAAYAQLASEGYLSARRGSGHYVCDVRALYHFTGGQKTDASRKYPSGYHFLPGQIDEEGFPYNAWRKSSQEALAALEASRGLLRPGEPQGEYALRKEIASYLHHARGVRCEPEQMIIGAGNEYLLQMLLQILGGPCRVVMESPTYLQAYDTFRNAGCPVAAVPMDADGMQADRIPEAFAGTDRKDCGVTLAYVMPSHQFPLGCVMPLRRRMELLAWAGAGDGRYLIEDDHDSEFRYKGRPVPSLQGMDRAGTVIYLGTFSNSIMPSIRISYLVLPSQLVELYHRTCGFYASTVSRIQQMTVCRFISCGYFERHLNKMRGIYKGKHDCLMQLLNGRPWVHRIYGDHAGLHIAVEIDSVRTEAEIIARAKASGLDVQGMSGCCPAGFASPGARPVLLLGFGNLTKEQMQEGLAILEQCMG